MKRLLFIALAVAAPAWAQDAPGTVTLAQSNAIQTYFACVYQQVAAVDDGASDMAAITAKVAPTCRYLLGTAATIFANGDQAKHDALYKKWLGLEEFQVTKTVWTVRMERHAAGESASPVAASALPEPAPAPVRLATAAAARPSAAKPKPAATASSDDKPMSEWRRAYIAKHGHEPPAAR